MGGRVAGYLAPRRNVGCGEGNWAPCGGGGGEAVWRAPHLPRGPHQSRGLCTCTPESVDTSTKKSQKTCCGVDSSVHSRETPSAHTLDCSDAMCIASRFEHKTPHRPYAAGTKGCPPIDQYAPRVTPSKRNGRQRSLAQKRARGPRWVRPHYSKFKQLKTGCYSNDRIFVRRASLIRR